MKLKSIMTLFLFIGLSIYDSLSAKDSYYKVKAENWLFLRTEPNQNAGIVKKLATGSLIKLIDSSKPEIVLSGKKGKWVEVEYFTTKGWLFNYYITKSDEKDPLIAYNLFLKKLKKSKISYIDEAKSEYNNKFPRSSPYAESGFRLFREYVLEVINIVSPEFRVNLLNNYGSFDTVIVKELNNHAIDASFCEGDVELIEDYTYYKKMLHDYKFPLQKTIEVFEIAGGSYACDAGILISWEEMRQRIGLIEHFLNKQPRSPENADLEGILQNLMSDYVMGMDNTTICDFQSNIVLKETLTSFQLFEKQNTSSKFHPFFKKYLGMLKANKNKCNEKIQEFAYSYFNPN